MSGYCLVHSWWLKVSRGSLDLALVQAKAMDPAQVFLNEVMSRNQSMDALMARGDSAIQQFYSGAAVFVTGGSGFLGKQLIEKLLRATKVSKVFVLLRPKKGKAVVERLNEILQEPVFDKIREQQKSFEDRIIAVAGDVAELRLGMSDEDWNTVTDQVNIIFHMAAMTKLDTLLRPIIMVNTRGTREALLLGKACKNLKSYVYVSTAFSHACTNRVESEILEDFYPTPMKPEMMIKLAESMEESRLTAMTPGLIKNWFNVYTFSKAVAEEIVRNMSKDLPICIVRPAVVMPSIREPQPAWTDMSNMYGASGLLLGIGMGVVHYMPTDNKVRLNFIPVDYVNNATIAAGWETANRRVAGDMNLKIYSVNTSPRNSIDTETLLHIVLNETIPMHPPPIAYSLRLKTSNPTVLWLLNGLLHHIPAYIIDGACLLIGKERRFVKLYTKSFKMMMTLSAFLFHNFDFVDKNTEALYDNLSEVDREIFNFDVNKIDWREYMGLWAIALRKYILKDGLTRTEFAKKKLIFLRIATYSAFLFYFYLLFKVLSLLFLLF